MDLNKKFFQWIILIFLSLIWGTSFILIKKGLIALTPVQLAGFRMSFAFLLFLPFALKKLKNLNKENFYPLLAVGFIGNFIPAFLFAFAETHITSALAGMLNSTTTLFTWILGILFFRTKSGFLQILGIIIGFTGTIGLIIKDFSDITSGWNIFAFLILLAAAFYGLNTNIVKFKLKELDGLSISALGFLFIGPFGIGSLFFTDLKTSINHPDFFYSLGAVFILSFLSSFMAIIIFNKLIKFTSAIFAASVTYLIPFFAIFWGITDGEKVTIIQLISMLIVIFGVYLANKETKNDTKH